MSGFNATDFGWFSSGGAGGGGVSGGTYGSFYDTTTQNAVINTPKAMELNTTVVSQTNGFSITNNALNRPTRITSNVSGLFNLQFSAQLNRPSGGTKQQIDIWIRLNELDVPYTNTSLTVQANADKLVAAWNFFLNLSAGQYVELMWLQTDGIQILAQGAGANFPETPSVIATIFKIA